MSSRYPDDWNSRRREVYSRDDYSCQNCDRVGGKKGDHILQAHHIVPISKGGVHSKSNLVTLCSKCHDAIHSDTLAPTHDSKQEQQEEQQFILPDSGPTSIEKSDSVTGGETEIGVDSGQHTPKGQKNISQSENIKSPQSDSSQTSEADRAEDGAGVLEYYLLFFIFAGIVASSVDAIMTWIVVFVGILVGVILLIWNFWS